MTEVDHGFPILGSFEDLFSLNSLKDKSFLLTMGDSKIRAELSQKIIERKGSVPTLIHPTSVISQFAKISPTGVYISAFSFVQADSTIGNNTIILSHVNISHTTSIGSGCFIAGGAAVGAYTNVENNVFMGQGALSISSKVKTIGHHSYIGARALLTHDVEPYSVMVGIPAKPYKKGSSLS